MRRDSGAEGSVRRGVRGGGSEPGAGTEMETNAMAMDTEGAFKRARNGRGRMNVQ